jgi:hypothetical protein
MSVESAGAAFPRLVFDLLSNVHHSCVHINCNEDRRAFRTHRLRCHLAQHDFCGNHHPFRPRHEIVHILRELKLWLWILITITASAMLFEKKIGSQNLELNDES